MKKKKLIIAGIVILVCSIVVGFAVYMQSSVTAQTMVVARGELKQYVEDIATVQCKEKQTVYIEGSGKIIELKTDVGDIVKKGDVLAVLDDTDLKLQLKNAEAQISAAKSQLESTNESNYANQIEIAALQVAQAETANNSAVRNLEKAKALYEAGVLSNEDYLNAQDACETAKLALKTANLQLEEAKKGVPDYIKKGYASQLEQAVILKDTLLKSIEKQKLLSPADGVILEKFVENNLIAAPGTPGFVIGDTANLQLEANILSDESYKVNIGDEVEITGDFLEDSVLRGKVIKIAPVAKEITSTLGVNQKRVQIIIELEDGTLLKPNYDVDIKITTESKNDIIVVPESAVFDYEGGTCVFVVQDEKAIIRKITKGLEGDGLLEVMEGLAEGETILVKPDNSIKEGIRIISEN